MSVRAATVSRLRAKIKDHQNALRIPHIDLRSLSSVLKGVFNTTFAKVGSRPSAPSPFLRLPGKVRNMIYKALFDVLMPSRLVVRDPGKLIPYIIPRLENTFPRPLLAFCYASRQLYLESVSLLLEDKEIVLEDLMAIKTLLDFLAWPLNERFADSIRSLSFDSAINWRPHMTHTSRDLFQKCSKVRHVKIEVTPSICVDGPRIRSKGEIIEQMDLCCLLDCEELSTLTILCRGGDITAAMLNTTRELVFKPLVLWLRHNICGNGKVRLVIEYADMHNGLVTGPSN